MPSPVAHAAISWAILRGAPTQAVPWRGRSLLVAAALLGSLPDLDYLPGLAAGSMSRWHQGISHSLAGAVAFALAGLLVARLASGRLGRPLPVALWCLALSAGHLMLDMATLDTSYPVGIPLLWPLFPGHVSFNAGLFPHFQKQTLRALLCTPGNLSALAREVAAMIPLALLGYGAARLTGRRRP